MLSRTTGIQRIWLTASMLYLAGVVIWEVKHWPSAELAMRHRINDTDALIEPHRRRGTPVTDPALIQHLESLPPSGVEELNAHVIEQQAQYSDRVNFQYVEERYVAERARLSRDRMAGALKCVGVWIVPQILIFVIVMATRWIVGGFRR